METKENSNQMANHGHSIKSATTKFSINNLLSEISSKVLNFNNKNPTPQIKVPPTHNISSASEPIKNSISSTLATKNLQTLTNQYQ